MKKIFWISIFALAALTAGGIGILRMQSNEQERDNLRQQQEAVERTKKYNVEVREKLTAMEKDFYKTSVEAAGEERDRDLAAGRNRLAVEQLYETKIQNLRSARDEKLKEILEKYPQ
jgi:hypothetical protein